MKKTLKTGVVLVCVLSALCTALPMSRIDFTAVRLAETRWEYTYTVSNLALYSYGPAAIEQFTIWFDEGLCRNLVVTTAGPLQDQWDVICWQPEPLLGDNGAFDAQVVNSSFSIARDQSVAGFSVAFDWLGAGAPGAQAYDIVDPVTFHAIESRFTVPEPATLSLIMLGGCLAHRCRRRKS